VGEEFLLLHRYDRRRVYYNRLRVFNVFIYSGLVPARDAQIIEDLKVSY